MSVGKSLTSFFSRIKRPLTSYVKRLNEPTNRFNSNSLMHHNNRHMSTLPRYLSITCSIATSTLPAVGLDHQLGGILNPTDIDTELGQSILEVLCNFHSEDVAIFRDDTPNVIDPDLDWDLKNSP